MKPYFQTPQLTLYNSDCLEGLRQLPDNFIDCCVTSPPYYALRDYGTATWLNGNPDCDHVANPKATKTFGNLEFNEGRPSREATKTPGYYADICPKCGAEKVDYQIGLEPSPEEYVLRMVAVFQEVRRVLKPEGTAWVNLGDSYSGSNSTDKSCVRSNTISGSSGGQTHSYRKQAIGVVNGLKPKDLIGIPWRFAFALQADGWYLRQDIIWHKPNPMPESVTDRCTKAHEYIFLLSKSPKYFYDAEAIKEKTGKECPPEKYAEIKANGTWPSGGITQYAGSLKTAPRLTSPSGRNRRSVWTIASKPFSEAHFAVFPPDLVEPCILAGCPPDGVVLDPFAGSGTTLMVAKDMGRKAVGFELNPDYCAIAAKRCQQLTIFGVNQ